MTIEATQGFDARTENYMINRFPLAKRLLEIGGVWGNLPKAGQTEIWQNVAMHCIKQAQATEVLVDLLRLPNLQSYNAIFAAMIHDWDKIYQMTGLRAIDQEVKVGVLSEQEAGKKKYEFIEKSEQHGADGMRQQGIPDSVIRIANADGHTFLPRFINGQSTFEEQLFHYLGSITHGNRIVLLDDKIKSLEAKEAYRSMNQYGRNLKSITGGRTLYDTQAEVGHQIEVEIFNQLAQLGKLDNELEAILSEDPRRLPLFIAGKISEKYGKI
jgi:hypothetical protein